MRVLAVLFAATLAASAQTPQAKVPGKVDTALRARVNEFHHQQMAGNFRKAFDLVAKDSQDYFLSVSKDQPKVFSIDEIQYSDKFTKAAVRVAATNRILVGSRAIDVPTSAVDYWKLQGGKWMWYHNLEADKPNFFGLPVGGSSKEDANLAKAVPRDTSSQTIAAAAQSELQSAGDRPLLDKPGIEFILGKPGVQELRVRNNYKGSVKLVVALPDEQTGVTVEPTETAIEPLGEVVLKIRYLALYKQPGETKLILQLDPFPKLYSFLVNVVEPKREPVTRGIPQ